MKLLQELYANGILSEERMEALKKEIEKTSKTEEDIILEKKIITEEALFELKSKLLRIPLKKIKVEGILHNVLETIPEEASVNYKMIAFSKSENFIQIGMVHPENILAQNALRFLANQERFNYHVYLITPTDFTNLLKKRRALGSEAKKALDELDKEKEEILSDLGKADQLRIISEDAPVVKMVQIILRHAIDSNASDVHIEPERDKLRVRFRQNGVLHIGLSLPLKIQPSIVARIKILSGLKIDESRIPQDGRFSVKVGETNVDFRVATFPTLYGEKVEIRILDSSVGLRSFKNLGLAGKNLEILNDVIKKPYGMILLTGPTGSGKTTTQYAILRVLNQEGVNIVTIEDPIEYSIDGVNQSQVKPEIGYTFAQGLRQILRQDPNVIMVGEIRDNETADLAVNAALTGHIVLSTLHTNSSVGVVPRLIDLGVKPFLIPSALRAVISQRLVRTLCEKCKIKIKPTEKVKKYILDTIKDLPESEKNIIRVPSPLFIYKAEGCEKCNNTGYSGRAGLFEVLAMSYQLAETILRNPLESAIFKVAKEQGMIPMNQVGIIKILEGITSIEEVTRATEEK